MAPTSSCKTKIMGRSVKIRLSVNLAIYVQNLIKNCQLHTIDKFLSKELCKISLCLMYKKPKPQNYYEKLREKKYSNWKKIYILPST